LKVCQNFSEPDAPPNSPSQGFDFTEENINLKNKNEIAPTL